MKTLKHLGILCLSMVILVGCSKKDEGEENPTPTPPEPTPKEVKGKIELPGNSTLTPNTVEVYQDGKKVEVTSEGTFTSTGETFVVKNKDNRTVYLNYSSVGNSLTKKAVTLNATETAVSMLIPIIPNILTSFSDESFQSIKQLLSELPETKSLATAIEKSISKNDYLNIDEVNIEYKKAVDQVIKLIGLDEKNSNRSYTSALTQRKSPSVVKGKHKGIRIDMKSSNYNETTNAWECTFTAYSDRLSYCSVAQAYNVTQNPDGTYNYEKGDSYTNEMQYILPPMSSSKFLKTFTNWEGLKNYFSETRRLFFDKDFSILDMTYDLTKTEDIKMEFTAPNQGIVILTSKESRYLEVYNVATLVLTPAIKAIGQNIKSEGVKKFIKDYVFALMSDMEFVNKFALIMDNTSINKLTKMEQVTELFFTYFKKHVEGVLKGELDKVLSAIFLEIVGKDNWAPVDAVLENISLLHKITLTFCGTFGQLFGIGNESGLFFEVNDLDFDFSVSKKDINLKEGDKTDVSIIGSGKYSINSNDNNIATISVVKPGLFTIIAKKKGKTSITVKDTQANKTLSINVTVTGLPIPEGVVIENGVLKKWPCDKIPSDGKITIPSNVTEIGEKAFYDCDYLLSVVIPNSVTTIGKEAFYSCYRLKNITFSENLTSIGEYAFASLESLTDIIIPKGVTSIEKGAFSSSNIKKLIIPEGVKNVGESAFSSCKNLKTLQIAGSVETFGDNVFSYCENLTDVVIAKGVKIIENRMFYGCRNLSNVDMPNTITEIGKEAFAYCTGLTNVIIPNSVKIIGGAAFKDCTKLTNAILSNSLLNISVYAFQNCTSLNSIKIPNSVTQIGVQAFANSGVESVEFGNSLQKIGESAFASCSGLVAVNIPNTVKEIESNAFNSCNNLKTVQIAGSVETIGEQAFYNCTALATVTLNNGIKTIGNNVFFNCSSLTKIVVPDSVRSMGTFVFYNCSALESAKLSEKVTIIPNGTFANCYSLKNVAFSNSLTHVGYSAFQNCKSLTTITFPKTTRSIHDRYSDEVPFAGCTNLKTVNIEATVPFTLRPFFVSAKVTVYVPEVSLEAYQNYNGSDYKDRIKALK